MITARVKSALGRTVPASAIDIAVTTQEGVVRLSGPVTSHNAADRAVVAARSIEGVKAVHSDLQVVALAPR
ncbi:MAG: BON domain-containing protein [Betaproteobacteria bacterium]